MITYDYLILGAGPAGLTFANLLKRNHPESTFLVLEKEAEAGGLCRSKNVDGSPLDIGGGHFLDVRRPKVNEFLFSFMPEEEWNVYDRDSRIDMGTYEIGHPFEANIWQMPQDEQVKFLKSIAVAGCNLGQEKPVKFVDWITWKLGERIAQEYMLPYNGKMFGGELDSLGTYWLDKLPNVSFEETLLSCLNRKPYGTQPGHARFYYPKKYGYGELWLRMAAALGENILFQKSVKTMDFTEGKITCEDGAVYAAKRIITTIPWTSIKEFEGAPAEFDGLVRSLKHTGTEIRYVPENLDTKAHWTYVPDANTAHHRILVRHNFCEGSKGYWLETNLNRVSLLDEAKTPDEKDGEQWAYQNNYTYPLNTIDKPATIQKILSIAKGRSVFGLGRWGEHEHYNSDRTVERAMELFADLLA
ncbi:MAG: FAD-dependent oxidoreductase [Lachnospiraceae bacterium]|nr:FAD-dependent oxidoreductase [Lachnospiraceae bacterium]MBQ3906460.1 FAD-dependent oxidoreductase [Lachnospiraceae bacterium]